MTHYLRHLDYLMLATVLSISAFGLWIMRTATQNYAGNLYGHQLVYVAVGTVGMMLVAAVPPALMRRVRWPLYAFVILSTAAVLAIGTSVGGGRRWINLGAFQLQPSEFAKLLLIVGLAAVLASRRGVTGPARLTLLAIGYILVPALLVFKEPDFGTMLVYLAIMLGMLFVYGIPWQHFVWMALAVGVVGALVLSILPGMGVEVVHGYQMSRLTEFLHPNPNDTQGNGFQVRQSVIAVQLGGGWAAPAPAGRSRASRRPAPRRRRSASCPRRPPTSCSRWWGRSADSSAPPGSSASTHCSCGAGSR